MSSPLVRIVKSSLLSGMGECDIFIGFLYKCKFLENCAFLGIFLSASAQRNRQFIPNHCCPPPPPNSWLSACNECLINIEDLGKNQLNCPKDPKLPQTQEVTSPWGWPQQNYEAQCCYFICSHHYCISYSR